MKEVKRDERWVKVWASAGWVYDIDENVHFFIVRIDVPYKKMLYYSRQILDMHRPEKGKEFGRPDQYEDIPVLLDIMVKQIDRDMKGK